MAKGLVDDFVMVDTDAVSCGNQGRVLWIPVASWNRRRLAVAAIKQYVAARKDAGETYVAILVAPT